MKERRQFIKAGILVTLGAMIPEISLARPFEQERPKPLQPQMVQDFVIHGHGNFEKVKEMLEKQPGVLNAAWDWGGGDFETALGGAGHMGRTDIAEFLIVRGARMDIFAATMLGKIEIVKSIASTYPEVLKSRGPHGLSLIHHAEKGGSNALPVLEYFKSLGLVK